MPKLHALCLLFTVFTASAQTQLPNNDFESWDDIVFESTSYFEALGWSSEICISNANTTVCETAAKRSTDAFNGFYALEVTTDGPATVSLNNISFTERPDSFNVQLKPTLFSNDTFEINVLLHENPVTSEDIGLIGQGPLLVSENNGSYKKYKASINYTSNQNPTYISVFMFMLNMPGNSPTVLVDAFNLSYPPDPTGIFGTFSEKALFGPNPVQNNIETNQNVIRYEILTFNGQRIKTGTENIIDASTLTEGVYLIRLYLANGKVINDKIIKL